MVWCRTVVRSSIEESSDCAASQKKERNTQRIFSRVSQKKIAPSCGVRGGGGLGAVACTCIGGGHLGGSLTATLDAERGGVLIVGGHLFITVERPSIEYTKNRRNRVPHDK